MRHRIDHAIEPCLAEANVAALRAALDGGEVKLDVSAMARWSRLSFEGHGPDGPVRFELERTDTRAGGGFAWECVVLHRGAPGRMTKFDWGDGRADGDRRRLRHGQIDAADLFSPGGDATLSDAMALLSTAFLRLAVTNRQAETMMGVVAA